MWQCEIPEKEQAHQISPVTRNVEAASTLIVSAISTKFARNGNYRYHECGPSAVRLLYYPQIVLHRTAAIND